MRRITEHLDWLSWLSHDTPQNPEMNVRVCELRAEFHRLREELHQEQRRADELQRQAQCARWREYAAAVQRSEE